MTGLRAFLLAGLLALPVTAAGAATYGDTLLAATLARHPELRALSVTAAGKTGPIAVALGVTGGHPVRVPLSDATGQPIGTAIFAFRSARAGAKAQSIADEMARRIYVADNLGETDPFVPGAKRMAGAQALVDKAIDADPDLITLAMHITPPGSATNIIAASNFGRIGKAADKDDAQVIAEGAVRQEVTNGGKRLAVELPMKDAAGATIGALSTSFAMKPGDDVATILQRAIALRDALARETHSIAALAR